MTWLAEDALMIWIAGAIALAIAVAVYWETRSTKSFFSIGIVVLVTAALLVTEWLIETPREAVTRTIHEVAAALEANDLNEVLDHISPQAGPMRADIQKFMPQVQIEMARIIAGPQIEFDDGRNPTKAHAKLRGAVNGKVKNTSMQGTVPDDVELTLERAGERWLIIDYTTGRDWKRDLRN